MFRTYTVTGFQPYVVVACLLEFVFRMYSRCSDVIGASGKRWAQRLLVDSRSVRLHSRLVHGNGWNEGSFHTCKQVQKSWNHWSEWSNRSKKSGTPAYRLCVKNINFQQALDTVQNLSICNSCAVWRNPDPNRFYRMHQLVRKGIDPDSPRNWRSALFPIGCWIWAPTSTYLRRYFFRQLSKQCSWNPFSLHFQQSRPHRESWNWRDATARDQPALDEWWD